MPYEGLPARPFKDVCSWANSLQWMDEVCTDDSAQFYKIVIKTLFIDLLPIFDVRLGLVQFHLKPYFIFTQKIGGTVCLAIFEVLLGFNFQYIKETKRAILAHIRHFERKTYGIVC